MAGFGSGADHAGYPLLERVIFGNRGVVLALFALITLGFLAAASQLRIDAGFRKQLPLQHEYMQTFVDYEVEFGGANRVFVALIEDGDIYQANYTFRADVPVAGNPLAVYARLRRTAHVTAPSPSSPSTRRKR